MFELCGLFVKKKKERVGQSKGSNVVFFLSSVRFTWVVFFFLFFFFFVLGQYCSKRAVHAV